MTGEIQLKDLVISKLLGQGLVKYKLLFPHVSAAIRLAIDGKTTSVQMPNFFSWLTHIEYRASN